MKKIRGLLHIVLIVTIIIGITGFIWVIDGINENYMSKEERDNSVATMFSEDTSEILKNIGTIAEFDDKYSDDAMEVPNTNGQTVGQLKQEYDSDRNIINEDRKMRDKIFYIPEDLGTDEVYYNENNDVYYSPTEIDKYGVQNYDEYQKLVEYYKARVDFFNSYNRMQNAIDSNSYTENLDYYVSYTDQNGNFKEYYSDGGKSIGVGNENYSSYFLFDRKNNTSLMENIDKTYADYETLMYKCKTFTDYEDFYAVFAINNKYPYDDGYSYYGKEVVTDSVKLAEFKANIAMTCIAVVVAFFILIAMLIFTGRSTDNEIKLYQIDSLWWDVIGVMLFALFITILYVMDAVEILNLEKESDFWFFGIYLFIVVESCVVYLLSIVRRFKAKCFLKTSLIGIIIKKAIVVCKKLWNYLDSTKKAFICGIGTFIYMLAVSYTFINGIYYGDGFFGIIWFALAVVLVAGVFYIVWRFNVEYDSIAEETRNIASGDINNKINIPIKFKSNRTMADAVNNIGDGISKAVEASVKNERMKTDLITNVSHDIKTPLTSIINYVDLLKMESIDDEKINNYIRILDEKSQRLKILTDDLVEASKLSSGVIELQFQKLNLVELIKQSAGEYEEKFGEKYLEVIMNLPSYPVYVKADGRKMWRVLENMYGNIYKYAMKGTRVYVDLSVVNNKVILSVKNISENPLNFQASELTERFIRGDVSRSTEGSGLGLSIAKSIIDRHEGEFKIVLDGDLFKVVIKLNEYSE